MKKLSVENFANGDQVKTKIKRGKRVQGKALSLSETGSLEHRE